MTLPIEIICILDRSTSMGGSEEQVITSFNTFIAEQKKIAGDALVTLILFDDTYSMLLNRVKLTKVKKLTTAQYYTQGCTALYDAVGDAINRVNKANSKVIVFIQTDGQENSSTKYDASQVKSLINEKQNVGWSFKFIGSDLTTAQVHNMSQTIGIASCDTISLGKSDAEFGKMRSYLSSSTAAYVGSPTT